MSASVASNRISLYRIDERVLSNSNDCVSDCVSGTRSSGSLLESKYCSSEEVAGLLSGEIEYVELEKHLVEVDTVPVASAVTSAVTSTVASTVASTHMSSSATHSVPSGVVQRGSGSNSSGSGSGSGSGPRLKYQGFRVPSTVIKPTSSGNTDSVSGSVSGSTCVSGSMSVSASVSGNGGGHYAVNDDELDDIWDSTHPETHSQEQADHYSSESLQVQERHEDHTSEKVFEQEHVSEWRSVHEQHSDKFLIHSDVYDDDDDDCSKNAAKISDEGNGRAGESLML